MFLPTWFKKYKTSSKNFLVLDVGTTGVKALVFSESGEVLAKSYKLLKKSKPKVGWVEQEPTEYISASIFVMRDVVGRAKIKPETICSLGITNQRETVVMWHKKTGTAVYPAIVWEDVRTKDFCDDLKKKEELIREKTGLTADPYFSASKIRWLLKNVAVAGKLKNENNLLVGTLDTWLLWNLSVERSFLTDQTNASRTSLFNIQTKQWDEDLLKIFSVSKDILPTVKNSIDSFGTLRKDFLGVKIPIGVMVGDQQASSVSAGLDEGVTKVTYGTGAFVMQGLGDKFILQPNFFTTLVPGVFGQVQYALEGKVAGFGEKVDRARQNPNPLKLREVLKDLAKVVAEKIEELPTKPKELVVDGGITQAPFLVEEQGRVSQVKIKQQKIYDGTALGVFYLLQDFIKKFPK